MQKKAIVVIHGMGNQYPMETITKFVENFFTTKTYSSPERVIGSYDHRKLIGYDTNNNRYDCYEYYWAHMIEEPDVSTTISWIFNIVYRKKSSERFQLYKILLQIAIPIILGLLFYSIYCYYTYFVLHFFSKTALGQLSILFGPFILYFVVKKILKTLMYSFGDVIRYTVPHPSNIATKQKISKAAVDFLTKLHDTKEFDYDEIIIVGHSLGSIIAYEMIVNTFGDFNKKFTDLKGLTNEETININNLNTQDQRRDALSKNFKWKVTDFITCGSALCHAKMLMVKNEKMFDKKVKNGEYPICPPHRKDLFYDLKTYPGFRVPTHDSVFGFVNWTNIFFTNDAVGGKLKNVFGVDIADYKIIPKTYSWLRNSHSQYWNKDKEPESFTIIKNILKMQ